MRKREYIPPIIECDEYVSEKGFSNSSTPEENEYFIGDVSNQNESVDKGDEYGFHYSFEDL